MSIKKTIVISVLFHVVFFSAALLFSAGLIKGSRNSPDERVFIVKLTVDNSKADNNEFVHKKKTSAPAKIQVVKQKKKRHVVAKETPEIVKTEVALEKTPEIVNPEVALEKTPEIVNPEVALEKTPEPLEEKIVEDNEFLQIDPGKAKADDEPVPDESPESSDDKEEIVQASLSGPVSESKGQGNHSFKTGLSPAIIKFIGNAIERAKSYPMLARKRGIEGTVHVSFRINSSGEPDEIEIKKSSGHSILDSATVKVVKKAAPYPHIKSRVEVPVAYRLRK